MSGAALLRAGGISTGSGIRRIPGILGRPFTEFLFMEFPLQNISIEKKGLFHKNNTNQFQNDTIKIKTSRNGQKFALGLQVSFNEFH